MTHFRALTTAALVALSLGLAVAPAFAGDHDPLFVNLISDEGHRIDMALNFGANQMKRGHPLTVFINDRAVMAASTRNAARFPDQQKEIADALAAGATVLVCPMCMKYYGVAEADLLPGLKVGSPDVTGGALFADGTRTLTW